ncbi:MAG: DNA-directed RNA polymerase subunit beta [Deltaproteobacteria bacterium]|jgi:DNA-directed RNA polymerase subunit beta|nr:DNA-directed RNA polymerase subunit beta [Deltaproteobacteria bacterium]
MSVTKDYVKEFLTNMTELEFIDFIDAVNHQRKLFPQPGLQIRPLRIQERFRKNFAKTEQFIQIPNLIENQLNSYKSFLQIDTPPNNRVNKGLQAIFNSVFPIKERYGRTSLKFISYDFGEVINDIDDCKTKGITYEIPLKITVALERHDKNAQAKTITPRQIWQKEIEFGTIPLMTDQGTFIINGKERIVMPHLHRSPGLRFSRRRRKTYYKNKLIYSVQIRPLRGALLDLELDPSDIIYARINNGKMFPVTMLLKAMGFIDPVLLNYFYDRDVLRFKDSGEVTRESSHLLLVGEKAFENICNPKTKEIIVRKGWFITPGKARQIKKLGIKEIITNVQNFYGSYIAYDIYEPKTYKVMVPANSEFTEKIHVQLIANGIKEVSLLHIDDNTLSPYIRDVLSEDLFKGQIEAMVKFYELHRNKERIKAPPMKAVTDFFNDFFFNPEHYDLSEAGRLNLNLRLFSKDQRQAADPLLTTLRPFDLLATVKELVKLWELGGAADDIYHLGNRRVRTAVELLENTYRAGLVKMKRATRMRLINPGIETMAPSSVIDNKYINKILNSFFVLSPLSQIVQQNNPLSEVTHKRRLSALGPVGLTRSKASSEIRNVHQSHYGRICPLDTPSGFDFGLIISLSNFARVNKYGFIETLYRSVEHGKPTNKVTFFSPLDDTNLAVAPANVKLAATGRLAQDYVPCHKNGEFVLKPWTKVRLMDVASSQMLSVAAALVPFLEHDEPNQALFSSNLQREAVPLIRTEAPLIGTGLEDVVAIDSGAAVLAQFDGVVTEANSSRVVMRYLSPEARNNGDYFKSYALKKFLRSNQNTCLNQKPVVKAGDVVKRGQVIIDGPATEMGELALGRNVLVAYMPWDGYNFNDSVVVSERLVKEDIFTSFHIEAFETVVSSTIIGLDEITRDIPDVTDEYLTNVDELGIVHIGAEVKTGDILVGRTTPNNKVDNSPEQKLIKALFGQIPSSFVDTSLRVPAGVEGTVIDVQAFYRKFTPKDDRFLQIEEKAIEKLVKDKEDEITLITKNAQARLTGLLSGKTIFVDPTDKSPSPANLTHKTGDQITGELIESVPPNFWLNVSFFGDQSGLLATEVRRLVNNFQDKLEKVQQTFEQRIQKFQKGDKLAPSLIKVIRVYVATKRKLSVGDQIADRHGSRGVVSLILPEADMPLLEDGTPVDVILNPLSLSSRLNVGQIMETHLGWASWSIGQKIGDMVDDYDYHGLRLMLKKLLGQPDFDLFCDGLSNEDILQLAKHSRHGLHMISPVFDGADESEVRAYLKLAGLPESGQAVLRDGRTGQDFENEVTVGVKYMLKLSPTVDDIFQARSTGPYSLLTQQPIGGKEHLYGQRLDEETIWALGAQGAAYNLHEFLTLKSDDMSGRIKAYTKIVKGNYNLEAGEPDSFRSLISELKSLALEVDLINSTDKVKT